MTDTALFVDDEPSILKAVERLFSESPIRLLEAGSGEEALAILRENEVGVIVSDNMMPGMRGIELLARARSISSDTARILMTGYADLPTAIDAINRGEVFRFLVKPWDDETLVRTVEEGMNRYRMVRTLRRADEPTLRSLAQTIELKDPYTRGHCDRVADYALRIAEKLVLPENTLRDIRHGCWLHDCGKIGVPEAILNFNGPLDAEKFEVVKKHPSWGAEVARQAELPQTVVNVILYHHERPDGKGYPAGVPGDAIPVEARVVAAADVYDALITDRPYRKGLSRRKAMEIIESMKGTGLDTEITDVFLSILASEGDSAPPADAAGGARG